MVKWKDRRSLCSRWHHWVTVPSLDCLFWELSLNIKKLVRFLISRCWKCFYWNIPGLPFSKATGFQTSVCIRGTWRAFWNLDCWIHSRSLIAPICCCWWSRHHNWEPLLRRIIFLKHKFWYHNHLLKIYQYCPQSLQNKSQAPCNGIYIHFSIFAFVSLPCWPQAPDTCSCL